MCETSADFRSQRKAAISNRPNAFASRQKGTQPARSSSTQILKFALPDRQRAPAQRAELFGVGFAWARVLAIFPPIIGVGFWRSRAARAIMAVPKTAMHENRTPLADIGDIGFSRQILSVQPIGRRETTQPVPQNANPSRVVSPQPRVDLHCMPSITRYPSIGRLARVLAAGSPLPSTKAPPDAPMQLPASCHAALAMPCHASRNMPISRRSSSTN